MILIPKHSSLVVPQKKKKIKLVLCENWCICLLDLLYICKCAHRPDGPQHTLREL